MHRLLTLDEAPPHVPAIALLFLSVCIAVPLFQAGYGEGATLDYEFLASAAMTTILSVILWTTLVPFIVHAFGGKDVYLRSIAVLAYCTAPVTVVMGIIFVTSRLCMGRFSIITFLASGITQPHDLITQIFPYFFRAALAVAAIILTHGLRTICRSSLYVGFISACLAVMVLLGSFVISSTIADFVYPGTSVRTIKFFAHYLARPK
jgi:hypothetical protein